MWLVVPLFALVAILFFWLAFVPRLVIGGVDLLEDQVEGVGLGSGLAVLLGQLARLLARQVVEELPHQVATREAIGNAACNRDRQGEVSARVFGPAVLEHLFGYVVHHLARSGVDVVGCTLVVLDRLALDAHVFHRIHQRIFLGCALDVMLVHLPEVARQRGVPLVRSLVVDVPTQHVGLFLGERTCFWQAGELDRAVDSDTGTVTTHDDAGIQFTGKYLCCLGRFDAEVRNSHCLFHVHVPHVCGGRP